MAQRGRTSVGWFYGFKLHLIINDPTEITTVQLTGGHVADNNENLLLNLCKELLGKLYGDKEYIVRESVLEELVYHGEQLVSKIRKNMKNKLMSIHGFIIHTFAAIDAYHFLPKKSSIKSHFDMEDPKLLQLSP